MTEQEKQELQAQREQIVKQLQEWYEKSEFEINGRTYKLTKLNHAFRVEVLAFYSKIEPQLLLENYEFMATEEFKKIMKKIEDRVLFEDVQISKHPDFWEKYEEDYLDFVAISMKVICFPFYKKKLLIN